jgi:glyoxylase-like metal-dependent hydrolase (beta-lactamase superfamily II)
LIDRILPDLYRITLPMPFRLRHVHVYALLHEGRVALFDTGMNIPETYTVLDEALATLGRRRRTSTASSPHLHADHCGIAGRSGNSAPQSTCRMSTEPPAAKQQAG